MKEKRRADKRIEAHQIYQGAITEAESVADLEVLRTDIRGDQNELGMRRRITLEQNCTRRIAQVQAAA